MVCMTPTMQVEIMSLAAKKWIVTRRATDS